MGQPRNYVESAWNAYKINHPESSWVTLDSVYELLIQWNRTPFNFEDWPKGEYDRIPFLSDKSAFSLSRYVSETGAIQFREEWFGVGLTPEEALWMDHFFAISHSKKSNIVDQSPIQIGFTRNSAGLRPRIEWGPLRIQHSVKLENWTLSTANKPLPFIAYYNANEQFAYKPKSGLYGFNRLTKHWLFGCAIHDKRVATILTYEKVKTRLVFMFSSIGSSMAMRYHTADGIQLRYVYRTPNYSWPTTWTFWDHRPMCQLKVPYRKGTLFVEKWSTYSQLRYLDRKTEVCWIQSQGQRFSEIKFFPNAQMSLEYFLTSKGDLSAWAVHRDMSIPNGIWSFSIGLSDGKTNKSFSRLRLSHRGFRFRSKIQWVNQTSQGWITLSISPTAREIYGAYLLQLDQKSG